MKIIDSKLLPVALFLFLFSILNAGDPKVRIAFSEPFKMPKKHFHRALIGDAARGYLLVSQCEKSTGFQKFDASLKMVAENIVSTPDMPKDYLEKGFHDVGNNTFWFYTTWNKAERKEELFARKIDFAKGGYDGSAKLILKTDKLELSCNISKSTNMKLLLVHYGMVERDKGGPHGQLHGFVVLDENMDKVWGMEKDFPLYSYRYSFVSEAGNIYSMTSARNEVDERIDYVVNVFSKESPQPVNAPIKTDGKFTDKPIFAEDLKGNVVVAGYYANAIGDRGADGLFMAKINPETGALENLLKGVYNFPREISYSEELEKKEATGRRPTSTLKNLVFNEDGTMQAYGEVTAEGPDWNWTIVNDRTPYSQEIQGYYNLDIIAMNIGKDGEVIWQTRIAKRQKINGAIYETGADYGNGFTNFSKGENKFFLYSDNPDNVNLAPGESLKFSKHGAKGVLMAAQVDAAGKVSKQLVYNANDDKTFLDVLDLYKAGPNQLVANTFAGETLKIAVLTFE